MIRAWPWLVLVACQAPEPGSGDSDDPAGQGPGPAPAWQAPDALGPYAVGVVTRTVSRTDRPDLVVEVWYPAVPEPGDDVDPYALDGLSFDGGAYRDAPPDPRGLPRPLVVFSHGFGGIRFQSFFLTEFLASHGWAVVAPDHAGSTLLDLDPDGIPTVAARRPADVSESADAVFGGLVDGVEVDSGAYAVVGHSFGAWTALVVGGGVIDPDGAVDACELERRPGCGFFEGQALPADDVLRYGQPDPRVPVVVALAPGVWYAFGADGSGLSSVTRSLVLGGTKDGDLPWDREIQPTWEHLGAPTTLGALRDAGHWAFSDLCRILPVEDCGGQAKGFMEPARVQAITTSRVTAFLGRHQQQDDRYDPWLVGDTDLEWTERP